LAEVDEVWSETHLRRDDLNRLPVYAWKPGAEDFVAAHNLVEAPRQGNSVERPGETVCPADVVSGIFGLQLIEEPKSLLSKREGGRINAVSGQNLPSFLLPNALLFQQVDKEFVSFV
jgi:hypothetical protein